MQALYLCCDETCACPDTEPRHLSFRAALTWLCSSKLKIPFQMTHLIETSGWLRHGLASMVPLLKTLTVDHEIVELTRKKKWPVFLFPFLGFSGSAGFWRFG